MFSTCLKAKAPTSATKALSLSWLARSSSSLVSNATAYATLAPHAFPTWLSQPTGPMGMCERVSDLRKQTE
jgi:hypothetical protein